MKNEPVERVGGAGESSMEDQSSEDAKEEKKEKVFVKILREQGYG